jgi:hypothetical protein
MSHLRQLVIPPVKASRGPEGRNGTPATGQTYDLSGER